MLGMLEETRHARDKGAMSMQRVSGEKAMGEELVYLMRLL